MSAAYQGQCLCGAIKYEVDAFNSKMGHCHCSMCRKFHGAGSVTLGEAAWDDFRWTQGQAELKRYVSESGATRQFCQHCGSSMTFAYAGSESVELALGTLDTELDMQPNAHLYVGSKADWTIIGDDLPQYEEGRDSPRLK